MLLLKRLPLEKFRKRRREHYNRIKELKQYELIYFVQCRPFSCSLPCKCKGQIHHCLDNLATPQISTICFFALLPASTITPCTTLINLFYHYSKFTYLTTFEFSLKPSLSSLLTSFEFSPTRHYIQPYHQAKFTYFA